MTNRRRDQSSDWFFDTFDKRADAFDRNFDKNFKRARNAALFVWASLFVASSAITVGIIWVAWHFISKFW